MTTENSRITGTGSYLPEKILTNAEMEKLVATTDQWIIERTGIRERRIAAPSEASSDLGAEAAKKALAAAGISPADLDLIVVGTQSPDMTFPSTACVIQARLGARKAFAFDVSAACSGFLYSLSVADQFLKSGKYKTALVIGAEVLSREIDWTDRSTCVIFGDGAGAVVLERKPGPGQVLSSHLHSDGNLWDLICIPAGGSRIPYSEKVLSDRSSFMKMKGAETYKVAVRNLEEVALEALNHHKLSPDQIGLVIPHQANLRIIRAVAERLKLPEEKVMVNIDRVGNTSGASIPIALDEAVRGGRVKPGDYVLLIAFGAGLTWGATLLRF